jgi:hypothetical protein
MSPYIWSGLQLAFSPAQPLRRRNPKTHQQKLQKETRGSKKLVRY